MSKTPKSLTSVSNRTIKGSKRKKKSHPTTKKRSETIIEFASIVFGSDDFPCSWLSSKLYSNVQHGFMWFITLGIVMENSIFLLKTWGRFEKKMTSWHPEKRYYFFISVCMGKIYSICFAKDWKYVWIHIISAKLEVSCPQWHIHKW